MLRIKQSAAGMLLFALGVSAAAERDSDLTFRFRDETAPAGATVQMKLEDTEGTPISIGRPTFAFNADMFAGVDGIGVFAETGEAAGAAVIDGNSVTINYVTTTPVTGDHPIMTVTLRIREDAATGSRTQFTLNPSSVWTVAGRVVRPRMLGRHRDRRGKRRDQQRRSRRRLVPGRDGCLGSRDGIQQPLAAARRRPLHYERAVRERDRDAVHASGDG